LMEYSLKIRKLFVTQVSLHTVTSSSSGVCFMIMRSFCQFPVLLLVLQSWGVWKPKFSVNIRLWVVNFSTLLYAITYELKWSYGVLLSFHRDLLPRN